ncbi:MAG: hypothetical protein JW923_05115 [Spirochaetales bacterium]|nr:hypothetical protein [Spirochaetales bacterium]
MLIQRSILSDTLFALRNHACVLIRAAPGSGATTFCRQLADRFGSRATLVDGKYPCLVQALAVSPAPAGGVCIIDGAGGQTVEFALDALARTALEENRGRTTRYALVGGPFPASQGWPLLELPYFSLFEVGHAAWREHWQRGGLPEAWRARDARQALSACRERLVSVARAVRGQGGRSPSVEATPTIMAMIAASQGQAVNELCLAARSGVARPTVCRLMTRLSDLGLLRALPAYRPQFPGGRYRTSAAWLWRDQGLAAAALSALPDAGEWSTQQSWQAYVVEQAARVLRTGLSPYCFASADGAGLDILVADSGRPVLGAIGRLRPAYATPRGAGNAADALGVQQRFVVTPNSRGKALTRGFMEVGVVEFLDRVAAL